MRLGGEKDGLVLVGHDPVDQRGVTDVAPDEPQPGVVEHEGEVARVTQGVQHGDDKIEWPFGPSSERT